MQTSTTDSNFLKKNATELFCLAVGTMVIIVFLSIAFLWFDASNLTTNHPPTDKTHQPAFIEQPAQSKDLIAVTNETLTKAPFEFASNALGSLNAVFTLDKMVWRYTTDGWQDISKANNRSQTPKPLLENVHPMIWTTMLILASLLWLLMFCNQRDVDQLLSPATHNDGEQEMLPK